MFPLLLFLLNPTYRDFLIWLPPSHILQAPKKLPTCFMCTSRLTFWWPSISYLPRTWTKKWLFPLRQSAGLTRHISHNKTYIYCRLLHIFCPYHPCMLCIPTCLPSKSTIHGSVNIHIRPINTFTVWFTGGGGKFRDSPLRPPSPWLGLGPSDPTVDG